jgi:hypothetical protein
MTINNSSEQYQHPGEDPPEHHMLSDLDKAIIRAVNDEQTRRDLIASSRLAYGLVKRKQGKEAAVKYLRLEIDEFNAIFASQRKRTTIAIAVTAASSASKVIKLVYEWLNDN